MVARPADHLWPENVGLGQSVDTNMSRGKRTKTNKKTKTHRKITKKRILLILSKILFLAYIVKSAPYQDSCKIHLGEVMNSLVIL